MKQIGFFRKNWVDYEKKITVVASEGNDAAPNILDRSNRTAWGTADSVDANNTTITIDAGDVGLIDSILLLKHNFKSFTVQYWDEVGLAWADFSPAINPTTCAVASSFFQVAQVMTSKFQIIIYGTQTANVDKNLCQFIATSKIGFLNQWPAVKKPTISRNLVVVKMLTGKSQILPTVGSYSASVEAPNWVSAADMMVIEDLYGGSEGFLFWPCGGDELQFPSIRQGYRMEDIYLMRCNNAFNPEWDKGLPNNGMKFSIDLVEVVT